MASKLIAFELAEIEHLNGTNYDMGSRKIKYELVNAKICLRAQSLNYALNLAQKRNHIHRADGLGRRGIVPV